MSEITRRADRAEVTRRVERAEKLLQKGKTVEALQEYLQVLRDDPENDVIRQLAADLCLSLSRNQEAVALLGEVFDRQVKAGDATRASLTYKKLARFANPTKSRLAIDALLTAEGPFSVNRKTLARQDVIWNI